MAEKHKLHNVRLDDEVWAAVKGLPCSLNLYLRTVLLNGAGPAPGLVASDGFQRGVKEVLERRSRHDTPEMQRFVQEQLEQAPIVDNRPKNCFCKHCGARFAGAKFATICQGCKSSGHTLTPAECPVCNESRAL